MATAVFVFGFPSCLALAWATLFLRRNRQGLVTSMLLCGATLAAGWWSIWQARSSTAGIGFLFLPDAGALAGALALGFGRFRLNSHSAVRALAWLLLFAAVGMVVD